MTLKKTTTIAEMIGFAGMETRHSLRLWIDILRVLAEKHKEGIYYGTLTPEAILVDMRNYILIADSPFDPASPYAAPEVVEGQEPDQLSDVYSMGVILYEMLTGSLEHLHRQPPSRVADDVPRWMDPIVLRCIIQERSRRFLDLEEISQTLLKLKTNLQVLRDET